GFTLTAEGQAVARHVKQRHRTLSDLLELLGVAPDAVADDVEDIEHHLRPQTLRVFESLVEFWRQHPVAQQQFLEFHGRRGRPRDANRSGGRR
ncbi:MAG TPA: iron dependent repressor, metal binding and dimerization domain protein, partial [Verrucomicrobiota bacterium]|nr:iron dependent repressor, metal binding and dimerization domain protein [Verrucomicrobiota bacterium]